jgi:hypothetical protein
LRWKESRDWPQGEFGLEVADALLAAAEQVQDPQPTRVGERVEEPGVTLQALQGGIRPGRRSLRDGVVVEIIHQHI